MSDVPSNESHRNALKRAAAEAAVELVEDGMVIGLGTGSTAAFVVEALAPERSEPNDGRQHEDRRQDQRRCMPSREHAQPVRRRSRASPGGRRRAPTSGRSPHRAYIVQFDRE